MAKVWTALLAVLVAGGLLPVPAQAQIFATNGHTVAGTTVFTDVSGGSGESRFNSVQPFTVPSDGAPFDLRGVALYLNSNRLDSGVRLFLFRSSAESGERTGVIDCDNPQPGFFEFSAQVQKEWCNFALPDLTLTQNSGGSEWTVEDQDGLLAEFQRPSSIQAGRNEFQVMGGGSVSLLAGTTYHIYLWTGQATVELRGAQHDGAASSTNPNINTCPANTSWIFEPTLSGNARTRTNFNWINDPGSTLNRRLRIDLIGEPNHVPQGHVVTGRFRDNNDGDLEGTLSVAQFTDQNVLPSESEIEFTWTEPGVEAGLANSANMRTYTVDHDDLDGLINVNTDYDDLDCYGYDEDILVDHLPQNAPAITGDAVNGQTLQTDASRIFDGSIPSALGTPSYQWVRDADGTNPQEDIAGATDPMYELTSDDVGRRIMVQVSFDRGMGYNGGRSYSYEIDSELTSVVSAANQEATGTLIISGDSQVGQVLTATPGSDIDDADGLTPPTSFTYRWWRADGNDKSGREEIMGETSSTYTLVDDDHRHWVFATVHFEDDASNDESLESNLVGPIHDSAGGDVIVTGNLVVGEQLTANTSAVTDSDGLLNVAYTYEWGRVDRDGTSNREAISGATSVNYTLMEADQGKRIFVVVRFMDDQSNSEEKTSADTDPVNSLAIGDPAVRGSLAVGGELTADLSEIDDPDGLPPISTFTYQWWRVDRDGTSNPMEISGATGRSYTTVIEDVGKRLYVEVSFRDGVGVPEARRSRLTAPIGGSLQADILTNILSGFSQSVAANFVDVIWQRAGSQRLAGDESFANLGGHSLDETALSSGDPRRTVAEVARFFGIEVESAARARYSGKGHGQSAGGSGFEAYRNWADLPNSGNFTKRSSFALALDGSAAGEGTTVVWGRGDTRSFKNDGGPDRDTRYSLSSNDIGGSVGIDYRIDDVIVGLVVVGSERETDYVFDDASRAPGKASASITAVAPWVHRTTPLGVEVWTTLGQGNGSAHIADETGAPVKVDIVQQLIAGGFRGVTKRFEKTKTAVKADAFYTESSSDERAHLAGVRAEASRLRVAFETGTRQTYPRDWGQADYVFEIGARYDDGEAVSGAGMDFIAEIRYSRPSSGLFVRGQGNLVVQHQQDDFEAWGLAVGVEWDPGISGRGFWLSLQPTWNTQITTSADDVLNANAEPRSSSDSSAALVGRLGYGAGVLQEQALATAYGEFESASEENRLRLGAELRQQSAVAGSLALDIYGERSDTLSGSEDALMLETSLGF